MSEWGVNQGKQGCCNGCTRRAVGCHDVTRCPDWAKEVEKRRREKEAKAAQKPVTRRSWEDRKMLGQ